MATELFHCAANDPVRSHRILRWNESVVPDHGSSLILNARIEN